MLGKPVRKKEDTQGIAIFEFDFDVHGGSQGDIVLQNDVLPDNAVILDGFIECKTQVLSAGAATIAFRVNEGEDIKAATGKASFTAGAILDIVPVGTAATMLKTEMDLNRFLTMTVGAADLTQGKIFVALRYIVTGDTTVTAASSSSSSSSSTSTSTSSSSSSSSS